MVSLQYEFWCVFSDSKSMRMFSHIPSKYVLFSQCGISCACVGYRCAQIFLCKTRIRMSLLWSRYYCFPSYGHPKRPISDIVGTFLFFLVPHFRWNMLMTA